MPCTAENPCGSQSCIVARRIYGDVVHEDLILQEAGLLVRETCSSQPTAAQEAAMEAFLMKMASSNTHSVQILAAGHPAAGGAPEAAAVPAGGAPPDADATPEK